MTRSSEQERLDLEVATRIFRFRWAQWNERALGGSPLNTPGRFLAPPDDYMSHLFEEAPEGSPLHDHALAKVPDYSRDETCAFRAADRSALFRAGKAVLFQDSDGSWVVEVHGRRFSSPRLPEALCRASLEWAGMSSASAE